VKGFELNRFDCDIYDRHSRKSLRLTLSKGNTVNCIVRSENKEKLIFSHWVRTKRKLLYRKLHRQVIPKGVRRELSIFLKS
jgi:hypothetical protein